MKGVVVALACLIGGRAVGAQALLDPSADQPASGVSSAPPALPDAHASVFRSGVDLVSLNVIITDVHDKFVTGLTQKDFAVSEDGVPQDLSFFAVADVPLDLAILLDVSSSMTDKFATVQQAAIGFASHLRPGDRVTVVGINDSARTLHALDTDVSGACDAIRHASVGGSTALFNALYTTIRQLQKVHAGDGEIRRQAIAVLTDGDDTTSLVSFDDLLALARQAGVAIYAIGLKSPYPAITEAVQRHDSEAEFGLKSLAQETGARSFFPGDPAQLEGIYGTITDELANQYVLGYTSKNPRQDGAFRHVAVRVDRPNVRTRTRSGYQAIEQSAAHLPLVAKKGAPAQ